MEQDLKIIGQIKLLNRIEGLIAKKQFPHFFIINGEEGSGRHTLLKYIAEKLYADIVLLKAAIGDMNDCVKTISTSMSSSRLWVFDVLDSEAVDLSPLLLTAEKLAREEYIVLITERKNALPDTITSRAIDFDMEPYTADELKRFCTDTEKLQVLNTPGKLLNCNNFYEVMQTCKDILAKIDKVPLSNALFKLQIVMPDNFSLYLECLKYLVSKNRDDIDKSIEVSNLITDTKKYLFAFQAKDDLMIKEFIIKLWCLYNDNKGI